MEDCLFCRIIAGEIPSKKVYEDDDLYAFEDINAVAPTHVLIIPKKHIATLNDVDERDTALLGKMVANAKRLAEEAKIADEGYRVVMNCLPAAGQSVYHIHLHLLGGRVFHWPPG